MIPEVLIGVWSKNDEKEEKKRDVEFSEESFRKCS